MKAKGIFFIFLMSVLLSILPLAPCHANQSEWLCPNDDPVNQIYKICNYFPLDPGNKWQYTTGDRFILNDKRTCTSGYEGILFATTQYEFSSYMQNQEKGLLFAGCQWDEGVLEEIGTYIVLVPPEMKIGDTVRFILTHSDRESIIDTSLVGLESVTVPAGTFTTLRIELKVQDTGKCSYKTTIWVAKGIGMVRILRSDANPSTCLGCIFTCVPNDDLAQLNTPAELVSYKVNMDNQPSINLLLLSD